MMNVVKLFISGLDNIKKFRNPNKLYKEYKEWCRINREFCLKKEIFFEELGRIIKGKEITFKDLDWLDKKFGEYCKRAEQHEFMLLFVADEKMRDTIEKYKKDKKIPQKEARAMFRTILDIIGEDYSAYKEENYNE